MQYRGLLVGVGAAGVLLAALLGPSASGAAKVAHGPTAGPQLGVTLGVDRIAFPALHGTPGVIHATLTFFNHSSTPLKVMEHGQAFDWQILDDAGQVVWDYSRGRMFPHYVRMRILTQSALTYASDIPLQTQAGVPLSPGRYTLRGVVNATGASASVGFTVAATPVAD